MPKPALYLCALLAAAVFLQASPPKVQYLFPNEMKPELQQQYLVLAQKGKILFDLNCAKCHMTKQGRKLLYPNFSADQIKGYEIRVQNAQHEASLPEETVTPEELGLIALFLRYKKPSEFRQTRP